MVFLQDIPTNGEPFHCSEVIKDVQIKGLPGKEKVFVEIQRGIFAGKYPGELKGQPNSTLHMFEQRTLVFMRDDRLESPPTFNQSSRKALKPTLRPDFCTTIVPTRELLFRFSALTFNAHAIHLDKQFCRETEGHRNLLVHGPLTAVLMTEVLQNRLEYLMERHERGPERITFVGYRNLAPLYAEEEMKICVKERMKIEPKRPKTWDIWIEGRDGGYAVKGTAKVVNSSAVQKSDPPQETIPEEHVAFQSAVNA